MKGFWLFEQALFSSIRRTNKCIIFQIYITGNIQTTESLHGFEIFLQTCIVKTFLSKHKNIFQSTETDFTILDSHHIWFSQMKNKSMKWAY